MVKEVEMDRIEGRSEGGSGERRFLIKFFPVNLSSWNCGSDRCWLREKARCYSVDCTLVTSHIRVTKEG
jgi:hypothetical protein